MVAVRKDRIGRSYGAFFILGTAGYKDAAPLALRNGADTKRSRKNSSRICKPASGRNESNQ